jgi:hypothetical protein
MRRIEAVVPVTLRRSRRSLSNHAEHDGPGTWRKAALGVVLPPRRASQTVLGERRNATSA